MDFQSYSNVIKTYESAAAEEDIKFGYQRYMESHVSDGNFSAKTMIFDFFSFFFSGFWASDDFHSNCINWNDSRQW